MDDVNGRDEDSVPPSEAFSVLASETRLSILEALWAADERPVRFSELRREVGMRDSAQFNYHLDKLAGHFVRRTDDGYEFRHAGKKIVRLVLAGEFNEEPTIARFEVPGDCVECGSPLVAEYTGTELAIECVHCRTSHGRYAFPPGGLVGRSQAEIARAFDHRVRHLHCLAADGVCPECGGRVETTLRRDEADRLGLDVRVDHVCERCDHHLFSSVGLALLEDSAVATAHRAHGVDLDERPYWTLPWCVSDEYTTVRSEDPWRVEVRIPVAAAAEDGSTTADDGATTAEEGSAAADGGAGLPWDGTGRPPAAVRVTVDGDLSVRSVEAEYGTAGTAGDDPWDDGAEEQGTADGDVGNTNI